MPNFSEKTFGAKLLSAQTLVQTLQTFNGYAPPKPEDSVASLQNLLNDINEANDNETDEKNSYTQAVQARQDAFWKSDDSVAKLLSPIRASIEAQYDKNSHEYRNILKIIRALRSHRRLSKSTSAKAQQPTPINENDPIQNNNSANNISSESFEKTISQSERSYGSLHRHFADLILTLEKLNNYDPSNQKLKPANLKIFLTTLETFHNTVIDKYNALRTQRNERLRLYEDLQTRVKRVKAYIKANYGLTSAEYEAIKAIEI